MNVRNEPLHDMPCVLLLLENVKPPPNGGGNFVSFNMEHDMSFGNNVDWVEGVTNIKLTHSETNIKCTHPETNIKSTQICTTHVKFRIQSLWVW